jgi:hypothetical protein
MHIPLPWAIALAVAAAMGVVIALGMAARRGVVAAPERALAHVAHLLGGGLTGFMALAFPPAWPVLAAVAGMLAIRAWQTRRMVDIGLLLVGFGSAWTALLGVAVLNVMTDPAVTSQNVTGWFVFASSVLVAGLVVTVATAIAPAERRH